MKVNAGYILLLPFSSRNWKLSAWFSMKLGNLHSIREGTIMSETPTNSSNLSVKDQIQQKLDELASLVSQDRYGADGPSKETTFREIESVGYEVAQLAAAKFESTVTKQHQQHVESVQSCPQCGQSCEAADAAERQLLTRLGPVGIEEIKFHCNACRRSFFPSA